jgi:N-acetylmuramoyl-L-alanine amidase
VSKTVGQFLAEGRRKMKIKSTIVVLVISLILASCRQTSTPGPEVIQQPESEIHDVKVGLDPGHGWGDSRTGAVGNGLIEKDVNLEIALLTRQILEDNAIDVVMTREGDSYDKKLYQAAEIMNSESPVLVVSIHTNSGGNTASGTEACYTVGKDTDERSKQIAQLLTQSIASNLSVKNRGIFPENSESVCGRGRGRLYIHDMNAPSALVETGFLSNPTEAELLKNRKSDYARAIAQAILNYLGIKKPSILSAAPAQPEISITLEVATIQAPPNEIAFIKDRNVWIMDENGDNLRQLTINGGVYAPRWSPDGARLYYRVVDKDNSIYEYDMLSGVEKRIQIPGIGYGANFDILPDGNKLIVYYSSDTDFSTTILETFEIGTGEISKIASTSGFVTSIHVSPPGDEVAMLHCVQSCELEIFNIRAGISTHYNDLIFASTMGYFPTGDTVAIEVAPGQMGLIPCTLDECDVPDGLYKFDLATRRYSALVLDHDYDNAVTAPDISDDGLKMVFQIGALEDRKIAILDLTTGNVATITTGESPIWRP